MHVDANHPSVADRLIDTRTVAEVLGVHRHTVANMTARGDLRAVRVGPHLVRYRLRDVEAYIEAQTDAPTATGDSSSADPENERRARVT